MNQSTLDSTMPPLRWIAATIVLVVLGLPNSVRGEESTSNAPDGATKQDTVKLLRWWLLPTKGDVHLDSTAECHELRQERFALPNRPITEPEVYRDLGQWWYDLRYHGMLGAIAIVAPHPGLIVRGGKTGLSLSWPISLAVGPVSACSRQNSWMPVRDFKPHRILVEPGFVPLGATDGGLFFVRPGYRYVLHRSGWKMGIGVGIGTTLEIIGSEGFRPSLSPELLVHIGSCCEPGYVVLALRRDQFFRGQTRDAWVLNLGFAFW